MFTHMNIYNYWAAAIGARPYPVGRGQAHGSSGDWRVRVEEHAGPSESATPSHWQEHGSVRGVPQGTLRYGWKSLSPDRSP